MGGLKELLAKEVEESGLLKVKRKPALQPWLSHTAKRTRDEKDDGGDGGDDGASTSEPTTMWKKIKQWFGPKS